MIRLAFCIQGFEIGGTELNAVRWAERLSPEQFRLTVVHLRPDGPLRPRYERAGASLVHAPVRSLLRVGAIRQGIVLARLLARERIRVFHAHDIGANVFGVPWARVAGVPVVVASCRWWHLNRRPIERLANRWAYRVADRVLVNSPSVAARLSGREGVSPAKVVCIPNSVPEAAFRALPATERASWRTRLHVPADALVIGIVARLDPDKDHATLLNAFARVAARVPRVYLVCVGDGPQRAALAALAQGLGLDGRVQFAGTLTPPFNLHHLFDVSVLCSVTEAFPNSVLEAMAAGRPLVATRVGGVPDAVRDGETGVLVPAGDPEALAAALRTMIEAPARALALGAAAQAHVRAEYHEPRVLERLSAWYESLVPRARAEP